MLDSKDFDLWAGGYDKSVGICDESNSYPFAGYKNILNTIYNMVLNKTEAAVLDIGFGTGALTKKLYEQGCRIIGIDFSHEMIRIAKEKMPNATLIQADFKKGLPDEISSIGYDFIIATYSLHHLSNSEKVLFLESLLECLHPDGQIIIGDVAFENRELLNSCMEMSGDEWDEDEFYFVYDELKEHFKDKIAFHKFSFCAGILTITKGN
ncbi:class I SAM-dependent methyltransferase [Kineothrix sp. MB12-C1]|uniref:class I SAM-dependent methyltransferase n=1 Tax=Kineothrix sp. MB12-C1 TaxID=3070215 RepID=UPI0027D31C59|nr:class I SAM-dependent methyltransferase [Kineothrix sp. MB12-C1]WMC92557.1 class I SAM-dependent methyltransferase [Kineothrix sp. MB12-C1]